MRHPALPAATHSDTAPKYVLDSARKEGFIRLREDAGVLGGGVLAFFSAGSRRVMSKIPAEPVQKHLLSSGSAAEVVEALNASGLWTGGHLGFHFKLFLTFW